MTCNATTLLFPHQSLPRRTGFVDGLLLEQSQFSAVEQFSAHHARSVEPGTTQPAQAKFYQALLPATAPGPGQQFSFEVDLEACSGCKACVVACHSLNGLEEEEAWRRVGTITIGEDSASGQLPQLKHITTACHHCSDPGCLKGCPVKAYEKDPITGIVKHLDDQCIGCKYCTMMCPYEVPTYSKRLGIVRKCDMCQQRLSVGEAPACVQSCPNAAIAIRLIDLDDQQFSSSDRLSPGAPASSITRPSTRYVGVAANRLAGAKPQDDRIDHPAESHWPLAVMLVATQASVGILLVERVLTFLLAVTSGWGLSTQLTLVTTAAALGIAAVGLGIAPLHLGQPLRAWRIFLGLRTSWLSREAVLFGKYMGLLAASTGLLAASVFAEQVPAWVARAIPSWGIHVALGSTLLVGTLGLFSSGMIYIATLRQLWRGSRTMLRFVGTTLSLGLVLVATICSLTSFQLGSSASIFLFVLGAGSLAVKFGWEWLVLLGPDRRMDSSYDRRSRQLVRSHLKPLSVLRLGCFLATQALILAACVLLAMDLRSGSLLAAIAVCGLALASELTERLLYFRSVVYDRMPGAIA